MSILQHFKDRYESTQEEEYSLEEYLEICKKDPTAYATAAERMLIAIGEPEFVDTSKDPRLSRIFSNKVIKRYPEFSEFYGMEDAVENIVSFFRHAAQGLEEKKQILYLLGPVGGGKSSLAEKLKSLMQKVPFYAIKGSPVNESPLGLFDPAEDAQILEEEYGIPARYLKNIMSPWAVKRLHEFGGDISQFRVVKMYPSVLDQVAVSKTEPGDDNNQDISALVGKVNIRMLEDFSQDDPDAYSFSGGLCKANQGLMEFVEMFKAPIKVLHPLLTATQEGNYNTTEGMGSVPFDGVILAHSNESEWQTFRNNKHNEAFLDRVYIVKVPYCVRVTEEIEIYKKLLSNSSLEGAPCAPDTLDMLAQFSVLSRIKEPENSSIFSKMRVYDGQNIKDTDPKAKSIQEYRDAAGVMEGMDGLSTRFAFKILSKVFNFDTTEVAANPVHLLYVLEKQIEQEQFPAETHEKYLRFIKEFLAPHYVQFIGKEIQTAYLESYSEYGQNLFDRYVTYADFWIQDQEYRDPDTGEILDRSSINEELEKIEKPAGISNPKDFRNEVVNFVLRARANNGGKNPSWLSYEKLRAVIEKKMFSNTEDLLPVISFNPKASQEDQNKHKQFVERMVDRGYTEKQVRLLAEWYLRVRKSH
ncbi:putative serine protein kinase, PrkA [Marinobacter sp. DSM 26671]|jgi:serine protein kinase|uniref:PrkA family serine protein kinase n=3 Tax=Marinobacter TaxID=2742 RepID=A0ABX8IFT9_9GAMM|nr:MULTISPECIES: PrkA family serine protein kinase [Marinobacter]MCP4062812.1 PrkA family serine protein kinase [Gammaproteobacteria bacterium]MCR9187481.1 PrkA family serine protein kinase [Alteromonadaceae bacterium]MEC7727864.1 PrkA family serine protein kinase [Pseudomonadota bacterium]ADP98697.1 serine protein kinase, PrkA [Marinobacter adhaerens HP15]EHJ03373.1 PrkA family serine protein kinase [Marinobacter manganoxydans MnI7-9]|tara:strand:- start:1682 stop:3604 length:1923 start_codon:yes stop_codon:yes gene_type:complete|eukprot:TRINITY_DN5623_c0_g1_i1.p1 TRINITY_DN5623_c0_g1~~TRINITY_DN5623_c0_g1_i1.p1  ORF type:complete len:641 (-),score=142.78 TRINITY_DN5623_c0_g1_i1:6862-8784(-)